MNDDLGYPKPIGTVSVSEISRDGTRLARPYHHLPQAHEPALASFREGPLVLDSSHERGVSRIVVYGLPSHLVPVFRLASHAVFRIVPSSLLALREV